MVNSSNFLTETILWVRNTLRTRVTDPISGSRSGGEHFVMTSYPQRSVKYPIITIQDVGSDAGNIGMGSEMQLIRIRLEIRVWARNVKERDEIAQEVINDLRTYQTDLAGSIKGADLHDFNTTSMVNVNELGEGGIKSKVITIQYLFILT